ncbi:16S rRNA (uracil(1498)-N(3))-methyltransferase [bacterium]|nr:16S rRNA (uracil(1498)-N(3))-methyltransferase [bacterium]
MRLTRIYVPSGLPSDGEFALPQQEAVHLRRVLRLEAGQEFVAFDGSGAEVRARLRFDRNGRGAWGEICARSFPLVEMTRRLVLYLAVVKGERFDWAVEKATELGVFQIVPLLTKYTSVNPSGRERRERWQRLAESAAAQSGRVAVPEVLPPLEFGDAVRSAPGERIIFVPDASGHLPDAQEAGETWSLFVGPEGGFADEERLMAGEAGFREVGLGRRILRVETAALAALCLCGALG